MATILSLLIGPSDSIYATPLDNGENKNSRNVRLSQIRENIFSQKFLLIQYAVAYRM